MNSLRTYEQKRRFDQTPEPKPEKKCGKSRRRFLTSLSYLILYLCLVAKRRYAGARALMHRIFMLSPAYCGGKRSQLLLRPQAQFELARRLRSQSGVALGELFSFLSGLYFRGKLTYSRTFARPPAGVAGNRCHHAQSGPHGANRTAPFGTPARVCTSGDRVDRETLSRTSRAKRPTAGASAW